MKYIKVTFIGYNTNEFGYWFWDGKNKKKSLEVKMPYSIRKWCDKETTNSGGSVPKIKITKVVNIDDVIESIL